MTAVIVRRRAAGFIVVMAALAAAGCSGSSGGSPEEEGTSPSTGPATVVGIVAIGHSGLTGENTDEDRPGEPALEHSWATGTAPEVGSVYLRLVAARPETQGHVANAARGGAPVGELLDQARNAMSVVPAPQLVIVQTIDGDIQCDGTDADNVTVFGNILREALTSITAASPGSTILVVGQLGRPSPEYLTKVVALHPEIKAPLTGSGICDFFDPDGTLDLGSFETLTGIIADYEAEQARVCATFPTCHTDGGVRAAYVDTVENFSSDFAHLNTRGQAAVAALIWPRVSEILGLD